MGHIKFRAWDKENEAMVYPKGILFDGRIVNFSCGMLEPYEGYKLMQWTGLKDVNGEEIYEGDIVKLVSTEWADDDPIIDVVEWGLGDRSYPAFDLKKFSYETEMNSFSYIFNSGYYEIEVIGNIYENPELLEGGISHD